MKTLSEETRRKIGKARIGIPRQDYVKEKIRKSMLEQYASGKRIVWNKGLKTGLVPSTAFKKGYSSPKKGKTFEELHGVKKGSQLRKNQASWLKGASPWNKGKTNVYSAETIEKIKTVRAAQVFPKVDSSIEQKIQSLLADLKIMYIPHFYVTWIDNQYLADIFIPKLNTFIECDGDYWHGNLDKYGDWNHLNQFQKITKIRDWVRTKQLEASGFKVIRLWENEIKQLDSNKLNNILTVKST